MSDIRFETDQANEFGRPPEPQGFDLSGSLIKAGLVSTREEAQYVLLAVAVLVFLMAGYFFFSGGSSSAVPPLPPNMAPGAY